VVERVLKALAGGQAASEPLPSAEGNLIVVAHDLSPADMILFKRHKFGGFVTDVGGVTSTRHRRAQPQHPGAVGLHHARHMIRETTCSSWTGCRACWWSTRTPWCWASTGCDSRSMAWSGRS